jgi:hypothetical protein
MLKYGSFRIAYHGRNFEFRSYARLMKSNHKRTRFGPSLGTGALVAILGNIWCSAPFEPILMNQDDSKQCEHLLSQQNNASYSALDALNLHSI